ncbi:SMC-Scp complex subunit ScpB [Enterococcus sp. LJL98]
MNKLSEIEAILFVVGDEGIALEELSFLLDQTPSQVYPLVQELNATYLADENRSLHILEVGNQLILTTKKDFAPLLKRYAQSPMSNRLSQAAIETLAIIAYKQPITRMEVDDIRGVKSSGSIQRLTNLQLIEEQGRVDGPGRAILYGTTAYFMDYFGLKTMSELPDIEQMEADLAEEMPKDLFFNSFQEHLVKED